MKRIMVIVLATLCMLCFTSQTCAEPNFPDWYISPHYTFPINEAALLETEPYISTTIDEFLFFLLDMNPYNISYVGDELFYDSDLGGGDEEYIYAQFIDYRGEILLKALKDSRLITYAAIEMPIYNNDIVSNFIFAVGNMDTGNTSTYAEQLYAAGLDTEWDGRLNSTGFGVRYSLGKVDGKYILAAEPIPVDGNIDIVTNHKLDLDLSIGVRGGEYSGRLVDGLPDGKGSFKTVNSLGDKYTLYGNFLNGHYYGRSVKIYDDEYYKDVFEVDDNDYETYYIKYGNGISRFYGVNNVAVKDSVADNQYEGTNTGAASLNQTNITDMSYEELVTLKDQINLAIWNSKEWQEVTVPQGVYEIGVDIPVGHWTIKAMDGLRARVDWFREPNATKTGSNGYIIDSCTIKSKTYADGFEDDEDIESIDCVLVEGTYVEIDRGSVVFTPYAGKPSLGFK